jgi:hypothetical protein
MVHIKALLQITNHLIFHVTRFLSVEILGGFVTQYSNVIEYSNVTECIVHKQIMKNIKFYSIIMFLYNFKNNKE